MDKITFSGIGSRKTPSDIAEQQRKVARALATFGLILRSGGADGSDTNFEEGYKDVSGKMEIWLPWPGFNKRQGDKYLPQPKHFALAETLHPAWQYLKRGPRALHARNTGQILGMDTMTPVAFVLCWTPDGAQTEKQVTVDTGGTGTAIRLADRMGIPVINMFHPDWKERLIAVLSTLKLTIGSESFAFQENDTIVVEQ